MTRPARFTIVVLSLMFSIAVPAQTFRVIYNFGNKNVGPKQPQSPGIISQSRGGNLFTTSSQGGIGVGGAGGGDIFRISPGGALAEIYSFVWPSDAPYPEPMSGLTMATDGNFYGTTLFGGDSSNGTVFKVTPSGTVTTLHSFTEGVDGFYPLAPPVEGTDGNFYGIVSNGGSGTNVCGSIYKMTPSGSLTLIYEFDHTHGCSPQAPLLRGTDGNFYGTTSGGGTYEGVIFKITPLGKLTVLRNLDTTSGYEPGSCPLVQGSDGDFYGTTNFGGGSSNAGTIFKITPGGKLTILHAFSGSDGTGSNSGLMQATDGNLYGTAAPSSGNSGTIFRVTPQGNFSVLYTFNGSTGQSPLGTLMQHTNGIVYGETTGGGAAGQGVFYSLDLGLAPFVSFVSGSGKIGKTVEILGQGFTGTTEVSFNGTSASFTVNADTYMTATVPLGAMSGYVRVTTPGGSLKSNTKFHVTP